LTRYLSLTEFLWLAKRSPESPLMRSQDLAGFGEQDFYPDIVDAEQTMPAVAAGTISEQELARWLRERTIFE